MEVGKHHLRLGTEACVRLFASTPSRPEATSSNTHTATLIMEETEGLSPDQVQAIQTAVRRIPFTATEMKTLRGQMPLTGELPAFLPPRTLSSVAPVLTVHHMTDFLVMDIRSTDATAPLVDHRMTPSTGSRFMGIWA